LRSNSLESTGSFAGLSEKGKDLPEFYSCSLWVSARHTLFRLPECAVSHQKWVSEAICAIRGEITNGISDYLKACDENFTPGIHMPAASCAAECCERATTFCAEQDRGNWHWFASGKL